MPQRSEKLRQVLGELERELDSLESLDEETRAILADAAQEIQASLHRREPKPLEPESLADRLKLAVQSFEADHPTLAGAVTRVIDALGQMGI